MSSKRSKKKTENPKVEDTASTEQDGDLDTPTPVHEFAADKFMKIVVDVAVNGHQPNDHLTVERDHPFYSGLVNQKLAREVK